MTHQSQPCQQSCIFVQYGNIFHLDKKVYKKKVPPIKQDPANRQLANYYKEEPQFYEPKWVLKYFELFEIEAKHDWLKACYSLKYKDFLKELCQYQKDFDTFYPYPYQEQFGPVKLNQPSSVFHNRCQSLASCLARYTFQDFRDQTAISLSIR